MTINFHSRWDEETYLKAAKWSKSRRRAFLYDRMLIQIIVHANAKAWVSATAFAVILTLVALAIVPKLEFDFEVIMNIANFCF